MPPPVFRPLVAVCSVLLACGTAAAAPLLVYEPFDYPDATALAGTAASGMNLTGTWSSSAVPSFLELRAASPGLDYGSLTGVPGAAGNRLSQDSGTTAATATVSVDQDVGIGSGEAIFWSALFTFDDSTNGNRFAEISLRDELTGDEIVFGEAVVGIRAIRVAASTAATGELVADGADRSFADGETLLLIGRYVNAAEAGGDRVDLVGYDTADAVALPSAFDSTDPNAQFAFALTGLDVDLTRIGALAFTIRGTSNNFIDELRIGSSYADVVPEASAAWLWLAAGAGGLLRRARSRRRGAGAR